MLVIHILGSILELPALLVAQVLLLELVRVVGERVMPLAPEVAAW
jgi:hypothetical protein